MVLSSEECGLIRKYTDSKIKFWSDKKIRGLQEECYISEKQFIVFVLSESGLSQSEVAEVMGYSDAGTVAGYNDRVSKKIKRSEETIRLKKVLEGD